MKKLFLLPFALLIMGVLFFGCEKEEAPLEELVVESSELLSSERSIDCYPCVHETGGCCCRLISVQGYDEPHGAQLCFFNSVFEIDHPDGDMGPQIFNPLCTIPATDCNPQPVEVPFYNLYFPNDGEKHDLTDEFNPLYAHGFFAGFCSQPNNLFQVCNPHNFVIEMVFNCELDVQNAWIVFELQPFECKVFRIQNCAMTECE